jgi:acyl carrier protein
MMNRTTSGPLPAADDIQRFLVGKVAELTRLSAARINVQQDLLELGLDSAAVVELVVHLEDWLDRELPSTLVWDFPSVAKLSEFLAGDGAR